MADVENTTTTPERPNPNEGVTGQLRGTFETLPTTQRAVIGLVAVALLVGFGFMIFKQTVSDPMRAVARGLLPEDQQAAVMALEAETIPYELADGGAILVPSGRIHEATIALAVASGGTGKLVGFEIFDQSELGRAQRLGRPDPVGFGDPRTSSGGGHSNPRREWHRTHVSPTRVCGRPERNDARGPRRWRLACR
jgi:hypothetical protein